MKKTSLLLIITVVLISSCSNKPKAGKGGTNKDTAAVQTGKLEDVDDAEEKKKEELTNLAPYSPDKLKEMLPAELAGTVQSDIRSADAMGASTATAKYVISDSSEIQLSIIDCAGPGGVGIYNMQYLGRYTVNEENEDEYTKSVDFNGGKAFENCRKNHNRCTFTFFSGDRFLIALEGDNIGIDELKNLARGLRIK